MKHESNIARKMIRANRAELAKPEQPAPAWHDKPTEPGLWVQWLPGIGNTFEYVGDYTYSGEWGGRWYGPIPKDTK